MESNTAKFAQRELEILSASSPDKNNRPIIEPFKNEILSLCEAFGKSGQSGGSAPYTASAISQTIKKLLLQNPIMPMTGIDEEWVNVSEYGGGKEEKECVWQNKRCGGLFKNAQGKCWYLDAIVWKRPDGGTFTGSAILKDGKIEQQYYSRNYVKSFPFTPKTFYVDVVTEYKSETDWENYIKTPTQLHRVFKYYNRY